MGWLGVGETSVDGEGDGEREVDIILLLYIFLTLTEPQIKRPFLSLDDREPRVARILVKRAIVVHVVKDHRTSCLRFNLEVFSER